MLHAARGSWGAPSKPKSAKIPVFNGPRLCARRAEEVKVFLYQRFKSRHTGRPILTRPGTLESDARDDYRQIQPVLLDL